MGVGDLHAGSCSAEAGGHTVIAQPSPGLRVKGRDQRRVQPQASAAGPRAAP